MEYNIGKEIFLVGDIHGQPRGIDYVIRQENLKDSAFIALGDVGLGFADNHKGCCKFLEKLCADTGNEFYLFRGNHDNPASFTEHKEEIESSFPHIHILQDHDVVVNAKGERGIILAGGISIDRYRRQEGMNYWKDELMDYTFEPTEKYDFVLAHTGPTPPMLSQDTGFFASMCRRDEKVRPDSNEEQEFIARTVEKIQPKAWINGHFHVHQFFEVNGMKVYAIDIDEILPFPTL